MKKKVATGGLQLAVIGALIVFCAFKRDNLKGIWQYCGGVYNGKQSEPPTAYQLQRHYKKDSYEAFMLEPGEEPFKYEAGNYSLKADTCLETQTFSAQPSQTLNITMHYGYTLNNDTLTFTGTLPNGRTVVEKWVKVK